MEWSQFFIKIIGVNFGNTIFDNSSRDKVNGRIIKKFIAIWNRVRLSLKGKKIIVNQILLFKLWYIGQIYTIPKYIKKSKRKLKEYTISSGWNGKKDDLPRT